MTTAKVSIQGIFNGAKAFFATLDRELADPSIKPLYESGARDSYLQSVLSPLTSQCSSLILQKKAESQAGDEKATRELELLSAIYYEAVTAAYDLAKIRTSDLDTTEILYTILEEIREQMTLLTKVEQLEGLRSNLSQRTKWYLTKPNLRTAVQSSAATLSAAYAIYPPKVWSDYSNMEVLAEPKNPGIVNARVNILPSGLALDSQNGMIYVADKNDLEPGDHSVNVTTSDDKGGVTTHILNLQVGLREPIVYQIFPPEVVTVLRDGDELAKPVDPDRVQSAKMVDGDLPPGANIDNETGTVFVQRQSSLRAGAWVATIRTTDLNGEEAFHNLTFTFPGDTLANYEVFAPRDLYEYENGTVVATTSDPNGKIVSANVLDLPPGMALDELTFNVYVSDRGLLSAGTYSINLNLLTDTGAEINEVLEIVLNDGGESAPYYDIPPANFLSDYQEGDAVAYIVDPLGPVVFSKSLGEPLPPGIELSDKGDLLVSDKFALQTGNYPLTISTVNLSGFKTVHNLSLQLGIEPVYKLEDPRPSDMYNLGELVAYPVAPGQPIISARLVGGSLPPGFSLNINDGKITVNNPQIIPSGQFPMFIELTDAAQERFTIEVELTVKQASGLGYTSADPKPVSLYQAGEPVAWITGTIGEVIAAKMASGLLPKGLTLNKVNGEITVSDPSMLIAGNFSGMTVEVTDLFGGKRTIPLDIRFMVVPEIKYAVTAPFQHSDLTPMLRLAHLESGWSMLAGAQIIGGTVPDGTIFNSANGEITVMDPALILPATYNPIILTLSTDGKEKEHQVMITVFMGGSSRLGAGYNVITHLSAADNRLGMVVADLLLPPGVFYSSSQITQGQLPSGFALQSGTGDIVVDDPILVEENGGSVNASLTVRITYTDQSYSDVALVLAFTIEEGGQESNVPDYTTPLEPFLDSILVNSSAYSITLDAGGLNGAVWLDPSRNLNFQDAPTIQPGIYPMQLIYSDGTLERTYSVRLYLHQPSRVPGYLVNDELSVSQLEDGNMLALPVFLPKELQNAVLLPGSEVPDGTEFDETNGVLTVIRVDKIPASTFRLIVQLEYTDSDQFECTIDLTFIP